MQACVSHKVPCHAPLTHWYRPEPFPSGQSRAKFLMIPSQSSRVAHLLKGFPGYIASHVGSLASREKGGVADLVDPLLPCLACLGSWVDELQSLSADRLDCVSDPATLHFDAGRTVAEERWALRTVQMEHVRVPRNGCAEISQLKGSFVSAMRLLEHIVGMLNDSQQQTSTRPEGSSRRCS